MGKLLLPLFVELARKRPAVDTVRVQLGGRASSEPGLGELVRLTSASEEDVVGAVLFVRGDQLHVVTLQGSVRKVSRSEVTAVDPAASALASGLASLSADARVFATLSEGQRVRYVDRSGGLHRGLLVEKCRFGALVLRDDSVLMAVGFRKIWPDEGAAGKPS